MHTIYIVDSKNKKQKKLYKYYITGCDALLLLKCFFTVLRVHKLFIHSLILFLAQSLY